MLQIVVPLAVLACLLVAAFAERMGERRGKAKTEEQTMSLLWTLQGLLEDKKDKKALKFLNRYTSGDDSIQNIIPLIGPQPD